MARPWVEQAGATYKAVVDRENILGQQFGLKAVPMGILVDEAGRLIRGPFRIAVADDEVRAGLVQWLETGQVPADVFPQSVKREEDRARLTEANLRFRLGQVLLAQGKKEEATAEWRKAWQLDPENWLIRKQVWAVEHPERFYEGEVDFAWQKEQIEAGR